MARLNECRDSEEDLPELSTLFAKCSVAENDEKQATTLRPLSTESKILYGGPQRERKPLKTTHGNSLLLPIANGLLIPRKSFQRDDECGTSDLEKSGGQRAIVEAVNYNLSREPLSVDSSVRESSLGNNILRFVCRLPPVDAEHGGSQPYGKDAFGQFRSPKGNEYKDLKDTTENTNKSYQQFQRDGQLRDLNPSRPTSKKAAVFDSQVSSSNINDENSISGNGTQSNTPTQPAIRVKSGTPATNPSSPKLKSPAKQDRHPRSLYRPSVDTFWSQEAIEGWNLQYTPKKPPKSPSKVKPHRLEEGYGDYESPYKQFPSMEKKPSPKKQVLERQRAFNATRQNLATTFLRELDDTITNGQVASLAASTGGVKICWSKTLQSTAGRAKWKRESVRAKDCSEYPGAKTYRHHASIELAEKVIDDEDRLVNVLAHEFCHLATFMISGVKDRPHGKEFKGWARKCSRAFSCRNVNVTTKHNYDIAYKYVWACTSCGIEFKRHSKSIDPTRQSCGTCKSKLVQVKPAGRATGGALNGYQTYVKENYAGVKKSNPEMSMGEVMAALGRDFREGRTQANHADGKETKVASDTTPEEEQLKNNNGAASIDSALTKLDSLTLNS